MLIVKAFDDNYYCSEYNFYQGVIYAVVNRAKIINYSGGAEELFDYYYCEVAVQFAETHGCLIVTGTGNSRYIIEIYPAKLSLEYDNIITVGATGRYDEHAGYSCYGPEINVSAPGGSGEVEPNYNSNDIYSTGPNYLGVDYKYMAGTSMAAPYVAGLAVLLKSKYPTATPSQLKHMIQMTAKDLGEPGFDHRFGHGRIDAEKALKAHYVPLGIQQFNPP